MDPYKPTSLMESKAVFFGGSSDILDVVIGKCSCSDKYHLTRHSECSEEVEKHAVNLGFV